MGQQGLVAQRAVLLLRCQCAREDRARAELGQARALEAEAGAAFVAARARAARHDVEREAAAAARYAGLTGRAVGLDAIRAVHAQEVADRRHQVELCGEEARQGTALASAQEQVAAAADRYAVAARARMRRERLAEGVLSNQKRAGARSAEVQQEDTLAPQPARDA